MKKISFKFHRNLNRKSGAGFTAIELIVVIAVITALLIIAISNFHKIELQFKLSRTANKFAQDIRRARNLALSTIQSTDSSGNITPIWGYGIHIDRNTLGNKKYILYGDVNAPPPSSIYAYDSFDIVIEAIDFSSDESGIVIKNVYTPLGDLPIVDIFFRGAFPNDSTTPGAIILSPQPVTGPIKNVDIDLAIESDLASTKTVSVNDSGLIEIK